MTERGRNRVTPRPVARGRLAVWLFTASALWVTPVSADKPHWVGTWAASPQRLAAGDMPPAPDLSNATLRQVVHVSIGGQRMRVRLSNAFGTRPLAILQAEVALSSGGSGIASASRKALTFAGQESAAIPPGAPMVSDAVVFDPLNDGLGPNVLARLDRDILAQPGVRFLIVLEGINDLGTRTASAREVCAAYEQIINRAHARGIKVYGGTLTPCGGSIYDRPGVETARQETNTWIKTSRRVDGLIDCDASVRDPARPGRLAVKADCGGHLHPGPEGYQMLANAVDLTLFER